MRPLRGSMVVGMSSDSFRPPLRFGQRPKIFCSWGFFFLPLTCYLLLTPSALATLSPLYFTGAARSLLSAPRCSLPPSSPIFYPHHYVISISLSSSQPHRSPFLSSWAPLLVRPSILYPTPVAFSRRRHALPPPLPNAAQIMSLDIEPGRFDCVTTF